MTFPGQPALNPKSGTVKLRPRQLREQILTLLRAEPDRTWTLPEIYAKLGRRSGAVPLALNKLVALGQAVQTAPRRFTLAPAIPAGTHTAQPVQAARRPQGPVSRPNGDVYHPRELAGGRDVEVLRRLRAAGLPVLLYGPPGGGKTSLIEAAFGSDLHTLAGDEDTAVGDLVGDYVPDGAGGYRFVDGPLTQAMQTGGVFFIDDATLISPKVLAVMYPAMDGRRQVAVKAHGGRVVQAAPGFYVVAGHNPGVHGAILTEALASRFTTHIKVGTDYDLATRLGVDPNIVAAARILATKVHTGECGWAPQMRELLGFRNLADTLGTDTAIANLIGTAPPEDRDIVTDVLKTALRRTPPPPLTLGPQI